ncbi:hypothetical protein N3114_11235 [Aliarcobacter butzleri]|uniref:hypothetical protein n=2 Tax=Aliarcobacter butzleri TaxID=28197 RepID=UPI0021B438A8|nr:hypothetical protein [Aliarcobacter butzleri]UXC28584.1 hypothetical protein N3114_07835 [Aliarcobacter butzleri]UXC29213.1 hypothetical protein N3114_11235 [Aliarcobacter butzleri]
MKLRTHTIPLPTDYVSELRNKGKRKKSRCFIEYFYDMEVGEHNSYRFYGKSWEVSSSTAHEWIKEFNEALEIFDAARELKRKVHYQETNKKSDASLCLESNRTNLTDETERIEHFQKTIISDCLENNRTNLTDETERSFNYINNKKENVFLNNDFYRFISEIKMVIKNVGNVEDIYESYLKVKDLIDLPTLSKIYREYSNETKTERKVGLSRFLSDLMYLSYCKPYIVVENDGSFVTGTYDKDKEILITKDKNYGLTLSRYSELNADNRIKIIKYVA